MIIKVNDILNLIKIYSNYILTLIDYIIENMRNISQIQIKIHLDAYINYFLIITYYTDHDRNTVATYSNSLLCTVDHCVNIQMEIFYILCFNRITNVTEPPFMI